MNPKDFLNSPVSAKYNIALQEARINELPEKMRLRLGKLLLKGWVFTLAGSELNKHDKFDDLWAVTRDGEPWPALRPLKDQIEAAETWERFKANHGGKL